MKHALNFDGMRLSDVAAIAGETRDSTRRWLRSNGYRVNDGYVRRVPDFAAAITAEARRLAALPPSTPCFRCGAARGCKHRDSTGARWAS